MHSHLTHAPLTSLSSHLSLSFFVCFLLTPPSVLFSPDPPLRLCVAPLSCFHWSCCCIQGQRSCFVCSITCTHNQANYFSKIATSLQENRMDAGSNLRKAADMYRQLQVQIACAQIVVCGKSMLETGGSLGSGCGLAVLLLLLPAPRLNNASARDLHRRSQCRIDPICGAGGQQSHRIAFVQSER